LHLRDRFRGGIFLRPGKNRGILKSERAIPRRKAEGL
jgi:hypothetical protein